MIKASTNVPRGCVKSSWPAEAAQQQPRHGQVDDRLRGGGEELIVLAEPPEAAQPGKVRSTTHRRGTTANDYTIGGLAPGGSQRRWRPPSWRDTTWKLRPRRWWAQSSKGPR
jgi:hypothetical protein